jgi:hypothetical protein
LAVRAVCVFAAGGVALDQIFNMRAGPIAGRKVGNEAACSTFANRSVVDAAKLRRWNTESGVWAQIGLCTGFAARTGACLPMGPRQRAELPAPVVAAQCLKATETWLAISIV